MLPKLKGQALSGAEQVENLLHQANIHTVSVMTLTDCTGTGEEHAMMVLIYVIALPACVGNNKPACPSMTLTGLPTLCPMRANRLK